ncbi:hypothetical protein QLQ12_25100 [Actinoplanes sp. NEAU-A12]|uniref:Uncharacterized protein n=1 Tax=Actinoplanes sandaracinus TaxID=3045177 RepID=A0ABT6WQD6_9ACTN|nr:hypothetical protein [Actinoplanes sandaracinus]MDI6101901.1 hypothetical protein [Actinoplanes sandaracinus]
MDQDPNEIYDKRVAAAKAWRDEERARFAASSGGNWLLHALAEESGGRLVEVSPGRFVESKLDPPPATPWV